MAKKKDEKDVLIVRDEKTGEISVVAGLQADGTPRRTPPKMENAQDFLQFDKNGDVLDNFFRNFFRQCKEPSRFGFYRIAADQAENLLGVMKELLKDPVANAELLAPHKVDTSTYEKQVAQEQKAQEEQKQEQNQTNNVEPPKQENMEQKQQENVQKNAQENKQENKQRQGYQPIDESRIDWQALEKNWGVKREELEQSGDLQKMLNYGKSDLVRVTPNFGGESFSLDARLSFRKDDDGNVRLVPHFIRKEQKLDEYKGHKFTPEEKKALKETGNLGRIVDLVDKATGEITPSFISIDRKTNEITDMPAARIRIPERIGKTEITPQEREMLRAGLPVKDKLIERNDGRKFVTTLQVNVEQRGVEFVPGTGKSPRTVEEQSNKESTKVVQEATQQEPGKQRRNTWTNEDGSIRPITKWKGVPFTEEQKADYVAGKTVKLEKCARRQGCTLRHVPPLQSRERPSLPLQHQSRQRSEGGSGKREPHAGGRQQSGQDQRSDQECQRAAAEGTDCPEGRCPAKAGETQEQRHEGMNRSATTKSIIIPNMRTETIGKNIKTVNQYEDHYRREAIRGT